MSVSLSDLTTALGNATAAAAIKAGYNGGTGSIELHKAADYVGDYGKIAVTAKGAELDVARTMKWLFFVAQGKPDEATKITEDHVSAVVPRAIRLIARSRVYATFVSFGLSLKFRASDCVSMTGLDKGLVDDRTVNELYALLTSTGEAEAKVAEQAHYILMSLFANGIHRKQCDGHSWFTNEAARRGTTTNRCCAVAGAMKRDFTSWMTDMSQGHDGNHHLLDDSLEAILDSLVGITPAAGKQGATYAGEDVTGQLLEDVVKMGEACTDRWPPGQLGKAAIIIGVEMMIAMVGHICTKLKVDGVARVASSAERMVGAIKAAEFHRDDLTRMNAALQSVISLAKGYVVEASLYEEDTHAAFDSHANRSVGKVSAGRALAQAVSVATPHSEAITDAVVSMIGSIAVAIDSAAAVNASVDGGAVQPLVDPADRINLDLSKVSVKVGVSDAERVMKTMLASGAGGGN
jgi:hypothetical protein